jgi:phage terminase large subunit-like protein
LAEGTLMHGGRPLMAWCVGNAKVEPRANSILITKQASGFAKIDPLMALFNAAALMSQNPVPRKKKFQFFVA